jgi:hypothetical protein
LDLGLILSREPVDCTNCDERKKKYSQWACGHCPEFRVDQISAQTWNLLEVRRMKMAGFVFAPDDLDYVSWHLLAELEEQIQARDRKKESRYGGLSV